MANLLFLFYYSTLDAFIQSAPWLILGFFVAGLIHILIPSSFIQKLLSGGGISSIIKGSLVGIPLPLCSCSVIPVCRSLRQSGASIGASASFLSSTPQIGLDSFILTEGLLGLPMAIIRVVVAFFSSILAGTLVGKYGTDMPFESKVKSCCSSTKGDSSPLKNFKSKMKDLFYYSLVTIPNDLFKPLFTGFFVAGLVSAFLPVQTTEASSGVLYQVLFMLVVSVPTYTCAVSSTPIAYALLLKGISPAAILVFLIAGPASNATTIVAAREEFGTKGMVAYLFSITISAVIASYLMYLFGGDIFRNVSTKELVAHHHHTSGHYDLFYLSSSVILAAVFIFAKIRMFLKK